MTLTDYQSAINRVGGNHKLNDAYYLLLEFIIKNNDYGACHSTSVVLYILMSELGFNPELCIGEVRCGVDSHAFDHSWVVLDGLIYDASVVLPHPCGYSNTGPIFASIDLNTGKLVNANYGEFVEGFGDDASIVYPMTIGEYAASIYPFLWSYAKDLLTSMDIETTNEYLRNKYKSLRRMLVRKI